MAVMNEEIEHTLSSCNSGHEAHQCYYYLQLLSHAGILYDYAWLTPRQDCQMAHNLMLARSNDNKAGNERGILLQAISVLLKHVISLPGPLHLPCA